MNLSVLTLETTLLVFNRGCLQCEILLTTKDVLHSPSQWGPQLLPWQAASWTVELRCAASSRKKWCVSAAPLKLKKGGLLSLSSPVILNWSSLSNSPSSTWGQKHKGPSDRVLGDGTTLQHCNFHGPCAELWGALVNDNYSRLHRLRNQSHAKLGGAYFSLKYISLLRTGEQKPAWCTLMPWSEKQILRFELATRMRWPFSYLLTLNSFPRPLERAGHAGPCPSERRKEERFAHKTEIIHCQGRTNPSSLFWQAKHQAEKNPPEIPTFTVLIPYSLF